MIYIKFFYSFGDQSIDKIFVAEEAHFLLIQLIHKLVDIFFGHCVAILEVFHKIPQILRVDSAGLLAIDEVEQISQLLFHFCL